jgi:hypothetical protein
MNWMLSDRADPLARPIADRHYNRQHIGSPQFVPPGRCVVLRTHNADALWITSWPFAEYVKHDWAGIWVNSCYRNESDHLSSGLISEAISATRYIWPGAPSMMCKHCGEEVSAVSFIDTSKVRKRERGWGKCYVKAGWRACSGKTKAGLVVVHLATAALPSIESPYTPQLDLFVV